MICLKRKTGFALVVTLLVTALIVAVATEMIHQAYVDTALNRSFRDGQQASILAESGATAAATLLQTFLSDRQYSALTDKWAIPFKMDDDTGSIEIGIAEESGRININALLQPNMEYEPFTLAVLKRLGKRLQLPDEIWEALADWVDSDNLARSGGAETAYYKSVKPDYAAHNGKLTTLTELSLVKGFTPEIVSRLRPFITIYSDQAGAPLPTININTAPKEVIAALDPRIDDYMANRILEERQLQPFKSSSELARVSGLDTIAIGLLGKIGVKGRLFRITASARVKDTVRTVETVVRLSSANPEILFWQEY